MKRSLSIRFAAAIAGLALVAAACSGGGADDGNTAAAPEPVPTEQSGDPIPATAFETFAGETVTLAAYSGKPLVVNFWASWCPSCVAEMSAAFRPVQESLGDQVTFLGVNIQDDRSLALDLLDATGVQWISAEDSGGDLYTELGGLGMPFTVFITEDGEIVERHNGALSEQQLRDKIAEELLA